jgi:hypothetical protein
MQWPKPDTVPIDLEIGPFTKRPDPERQDVPAVNQKRTFRSNPDLIRRRHRDSAGLLEHEANPAARTRQVLLTSSARTGL